MSESLHVVCPHCHTTNRVRGADLGKAPGCGQCHRPLFTGRAGSRPSWVLRPPAD